MNTLSVEQVGTMSAQEVRNTLNMIGYHKEFQVIFTKANGEQRVMKCMMEAPSGPPKNPSVVPVMEIDTGMWKSFKVDSVLSIKY